MPGGAPRIQETNGGPWVCDPDSPLTTPPPAADTQPSAAGGQLNGTCTIGYNKDGPFTTTPPSLDAGPYGPGPKDYAAYQVQLTNTGSDPVSVSSVTLAFYDASGQAVTSSSIGSEQVITGGQTMSQVADYPSDGATTCQVLSWDG